MDIAYVLRPKQTKKSIIFASFVMTQLGPRPLSSPTTSPYLITSSFKISQILADPARSCCSISSIGRPAGVTDPEICHLYYLQGYNFQKFKAKKEKIQSSIFKSMNATTANATATVLSI